MSERQGTLYIFSAPSGAGKTSLVKALLEQLEGISVSISHTTRPPRPGEEDGVAYHFTDVQAFLQKVEQGEFFEHAHVFGNYYGSSEHSIRSQLETGRDIILEIDWQGAEQVKKRVPEAVSVFILPPSIEELHQRLVNRKQDTEETIAKRMKQAKHEIEHYPEYDYLIINDRFETALADLISIVRAHRCSTLSQTQFHKDTLDALLGNMDIG